jgi:hypothetical protein
MLPQPKIQHHLCQVSIIHQVSATEELFDHLAKVALEDHAVLWDMAGFRSIAPFTTAFGEVDCLSYNFSFSVSGAVDLCSIARLCIGDLTKNVL